MNEAIGRRLREVEMQGVRAGHIDENGVFRFHRNMPTVAGPADRDTKRDAPGMRMWEIPHMADLFLSFTVHGPYNHAIFFMYDTRGCGHIEYWAGHSDRPVVPFVDGIPLIPLGTSLRVAVYGPNIEETTVTAEYAYLDDDTRRAIAIYSSNVSNDVKFEHADGTFYCVYAAGDIGHSTDDIGHSPNVLPPV